jgi:hypothetical protein
MDSRQSAGEVVDPGLVLSAFSIVGIHLCDLWHLPLSKIIRKSGFVSYPMVDRIEAAHVAFPWLSRIEEPEGESKEERMACIIRQSSMPPILPPSDRKP